MKTFTQMTTKDNAPEYLIIHHTGSNFDSSNQTLEIVQEYHLSLGWENFGYHYFINKDGVVRKGRPEYYHGAHCKPRNKDSIGICLAGNFDMTLPTKEQEESLSKLLKELSTKYAIPEENVVPHRKYNTGKSCFGKNLSDDWAKSLLKEEKKEMVLVPVKLIEELTQYLK